MVNATIFLNPPIYILVKGISQILAIKFLNESDKSFVYSMRLRLNSVK